MSGMSKTESLVELHRARSITSNRLRRQVESLQDENARLKAEGTVIEVEWCHLCPCFQTSILECSIKRPALIPSRPTDQPPVDCPLRNGPVNVKMKG